MTYDDLEGVITEAQWKHEREAIAKQRTVAGINAMDSGLVRAIRIAEDRLDERLRDVRQQAEQKRLETALRPISADPARESRIAFMERASLHWNAREIEARKCDIESEFRETGHCDRDVDFVIRFQMRGESTRHIAARWQGIDLTSPRTQFVRLSGALPH